MICSTRIPYEVTNKRYETAEYILTSDHYYSESVMNILCHNTTNDIHCIGTTNLIYTFKKPIIPKMLREKRSAAGEIKVYYWNDATSTWVLLKSTNATEVNLELNGTEKTTKVKITNEYYSQYDIYWCTMDYETESATVKSAVYNTITQNESFQKVTSPVEILED